MISPSKNSINLVFHACSSWNIGCEWFEIFVKMYFAQTYWIILFENGGKNTIIFHERHDFLLCKGWIILHRMYKPPFLYPFVCQWTLGAAVLTLCFSWQSCAVYLKLLKRGDLMFNLFTAKQKLEKHKHTFESNGYVC